MKMKHRSKSFFAVFLYLVMLFGPVSGFPTDKSVAAGGTGGTTGECTWSFDASTGTLTVSGKGNMQRYDDDESRPWDPFKSSIKKVVIGDGVNEVSQFAFSNCTNLTYLDLGSAV